MNDYLNSEPCKEKQHHHGQKRTYPNIFAYNTPYYHYLHAHAA